MNCKLSSVESMHLRFRMASFRCGFLVTLALCSTQFEPLNGQEVAESASRVEFYHPPKSVSVLPIIHLPKDTPSADPKLNKLINRHLQWAQGRYKELLGDTFEIERQEAIVFRGRYTLEEYRAFGNQVGPHIHTQHLEHLNVTRFNCPYVLFTVLYNPQSDFPSGRGGSMNGGFNNGGGTVLISSHAITSQPNAQSTIQHELGHAFGLPHVDAYDMPLRGNSPSIMSYNKAHRTNRFKSSATPGVFIPEDVRGLAMNDRAFSNLEFNPNEHSAAGYEIYPTVRSNSASSYPGMPDYKIKVTTDAGAALGSNIQNALLVRVVESPGPQISFDNRSMWVSEVIDTEANVDLKFPFPVLLSSMRIYSGHSGKYHPVAVARVLVPDASGRSYKEVSQVEFNGMDANITFQPTKSQKWRLALTPGKTKKVVLRGVRFYSMGTEIFGPAVCLVAP